MSTLFSVSVPSVSVPSVEESPARVIEDSATSISFFPRKSGHFSGYIPHDRRSKSRDRSFNHTSPPVPTAIVEEDVTPVSSTVVTFDTTITVALTRVSLEIFPVVCTARVDDLGRGIAESFVVMVMSSNANIIPLYNTVTPDESIRRLQRMWPETKDGCGSAA